MQCLRREFLDTILAEKTEAEGGGGGDGLHGIGLGDGHELDRSAASTCLAAGGGDGVFNACELVGDGVCGHVDQSGVELPNKRQKPRFNKTRPL